MRFHSFALVLLISAASLGAQEGKKRLVFPTSPQPAPEDASAKGPAATIDRFFTFLKEGKLDEAYSDLSKIINIPGRPESAKEFKERTQAAIDNFGPVTGYEVVDSMSVGKALHRQTCVSLNEDSPLRWRFYFYRSGGEWKLIDLRVDDGIVDLFEEVSRARQR
jgi:hypothetical protein